ncbi:MAG: CBS domain-containing protein [Pseudomonadota bacterium]
MTVASILAEKGRDVFTIDQDAKMSKVVDILAENRVGAMVVLDNNENVSGIISERDIVREISKSGASVLKQPVSSFMTRTVISCDEADTVDQVMGVMSENRFRHVPVVTGGKLVGIISIGDVVKRKIQQAEKDAEDMRSYIAAG